MVDEPICTQKHMFRPAEIERWLKAMYDEDQKCVRVLLLNGRVLERRKSTLVEAKTTPMGPNFL